MGDKKTTREAPASLVSEDPSKAFEEAAQNSEEPNVGHEEPYLESDGEEDDAYRLLQNPIQPKKITQQKRADEAAFDQWREKDQQKINGAAILTMNILESTNGFTQANEFRRIINSPREYQTDLFERAKQKNTIVVLDTGTGKTLIAILLLRHIIEQELEDRANGKPKRISFFLVEKVALCNQQFHQLANNLDHPVARAFGTMTGLNDSAAFWKEHLDSSMVVVSTAQVFFDCLNHGFLSINQINLLVFDEAHHTKKNHPYSRIMKNHYRQAQEPRPRILGLTASPVDAQTRDVRAVAMELEQVLCSEIATVSDEVLMESHGRRKLIETKETYNRLEAPLECVTELCTEITALISQNPRFSAYIEFARDASSSLGRWCADRFWQLIFTETEIDRLTAKTGMDFGDLVGGVRHEQEASAIQAVHKLVKEWSFPPVSLTIPDLSTKVLTLHRILEDAFVIEGTKRCLVFVDKRWTACMLADLFEDATRISGMRVAYMVGSQPTATNFGNMSIAKQDATITKFKNGTFNCLFATNVAEEGIDIPECDLVIRFDLYSSVIQYLQSKGRARQDKSKFINMVEEGNMQHENILQRAIRDANALRRFCSVLPEDRKVQDFVFDTATALECEMASEKVYEAPSTGARLTYANSLDVLARFTSSLTVIGESNPSPEYITTTSAGKFVADVILPDASPIRSVSGYAQRSKLLARCCAAFETCVKLHKKKYINDHFQSEFIKKVHKMRNARLAVSANKKDEYNMRIRPAIWQDLGHELPAKLFVTEIKLQDPVSAGPAVRSLLLLTRQSMPDLPEFPVFFGNGKSSEVKFTKSQKLLEVSEKEMRGLGSFTLRIFADIFSKDYDIQIEELPYYLGPRTSNDVGAVDDDEPKIDWDLVETVQEKEFLSWEGAPEDFFEDKFVIDPWDGGRKFAIHGINKSLRPTDPTPPGVPEPRARGYRISEKNIKEYSNSLWSNSRKKFQLKDDQPVVTAELLPLRRDILDDFEIDEEIGNRCYVILEPLKVSPLPMDIVTMAMTFPAIMHRIDAFLIALDACKMLNLPINPKLALEAVTKDSDNSDEHSEKKINFQAGMGPNYERLEFLGDTFLKMAVTIAIYSQCPHSDECQSHVERMLLICNQNLFNHAVNRGLQEYIRSKSFDRRTWYPNLKLKRGKMFKTEVKHTLGDKTVADVCEALIGAAYLSTDGNFDMAVKAVTKMVKGKNHKMLAFNDYYEAYKPNMPKWQTGPSTMAQRMIVRQIAESVGYEFKSPTLLQSAFIHPSWTYERLPHYERLEFLGDALIDMAVVDHLYKRFPIEDPSWLTRHKTAMVSNEFLGCISVKLKLRQHLKHSTTAIIGKMNDYVADLEQAELEARRETGTTGENLLAGFWHKAQNPPKVLPDIVESLVGAMFVDSQYNYAVVQDFFNRHIQPYFEDMDAYDRNARGDPVSALQQKVHHEFCCTRVRILTKEVPLSPDYGLRALTQNEMQAALLVHGKVILDAKAETGRDAKNVVASLALKKLEGMSAEVWRKEMECDCRAGLETLRDMENISME